MSKSYLQNLSVAQNARLSTFLPYSDLPPTVPFFQKDIVIPKDFTPTFTNTQRLIQKYADVTFPNDVNQKRDFISRTNQMIPMMAAQMKFLLDLPEDLIVGKIPRQEPYYDVDSPVTYEERKKGISNYTGPLKLTSFGKQIDKKLKSFDFANRVSLRSLPEYLQNKIIVDAIAYSLGKQIQRTGVYNFDNVGIESFLSPLSGFSKVSDLEKAEKATKARGFVIDPPFPAQRQTAYAEKTAKKEPLPNVPPLPSRDVNTGKQELSGNFPYYLPRNVQQQALAAEEISQNLTRKMTPLEILRAAPSILKRIAESGNYGKMKQQFSAYDTGEVREGGLKRFIFRDKDGNEEAIDEDVNLDSMFKKKLNPVVASLLKTIFKRPVYEGGALRVDAKGKPLMEGYVPGYINYILRHPTGIAPKTTYKRAAEILRSIKPVLLGPVFETPNQPPLRKTTGIRSMLRSYDNKEDFGQVNPLQRRIYGGLQIIDPTLKKYEGQGFFPRFNEEAGFLEPGDSGGIVSESRSVKEFPMLSYETQEANFRRKDKRLDEDENELLFQEGDVVIRSPYNMEEFFDPKKSEVIPQYVANPVRKDQIFTDVLMRSEKVPTEDFLDKNNNPLPFSQILKMAKGQRNVSARSVLSRIEAKKYPDINLNNLTDSVEYRVNSLKNSFTPEELLVDTSLFLKIGSNANVKGWYQNTSPKGFEIRGKIMDQCIGGYGYAKDCLIGSNFREKMSFQSPVKKVFNYFDEDGIPRVTYSLSRNNEGVFTEEPEPGGMKGIGDTDETVIPYEKEVTLLREKLSEILIPSQGQFETSEGSDIFSRQKKENE